MQRGKLITFEGIDGCGKSLMMKKLGKWLHRRGCSVVTTFEPGWGEMGQSIRKLLLNSAFGSVDERTEALLYAADRANHCASFILPQLEVGKIVLCDRFFDSTMAYQGYGRGLELTSLYGLQQFAIGDVQPDLTIFLRVPVEISFSRLRGEKDRLEQEDRAFFERVLAGYDALARQEPNRFQIIDSSRPIDKVFSNVVQAVLPLLKG